MDGIAVSVQAAAGPVALSRAGTAQRQPTSLFQFQLNIDFRGEPVVGDAALCYHIPVVDEFEFLEGKLRPRAAFDMNGSRLREGQGGANALTVRREFDHRSIAHEGPTSLHTGNPFF